MWQESYNGNATLYLVPTPIGNLQDMTFRAIDTLKEVDVIFCEDTRVTILLLNYFNIKKKLISLHDHNEIVVKEKLLNLLKEGKNVAIVTDRGTPIISDPGYKTVCYVYENGYNVVALPGACAFVPAIVASGISCEHFLFYGFLNSNASKRRSELKLLENFEQAIIFYEAPHRLKKTLNDILDVFGDRTVSLSREISKKHECIFRGRLNNLLNEIDEIKGEIVLVVEGNLGDDDYSDMSSIELVDYYISNGYSVMEAIKKAAKDKKMAKGEVYKEYHNKK